MLENYPGAKTNSGIIPFLVNEVPAHDRYFELFGGSGQLYDKKVPAKESYINDIDHNVTAALRAMYPDAHVSTVPALAFMEAHKFTRRDFIYLDPPYPEIARRAGKKYYAHELLTIDDHAQLLLAIRELQGNVMISTRQNALYDGALHDWRKKEFDTVDRVGPVKEVIYMNYEKPAILHQYDMLGSDYIERQHIKRVGQRFAAKIKRIPPHQLHIMMQEMIKQRCSCSTAFSVYVSGQIKARRLSVNNLAISVRITNRTLVPIMK